MNFQFVIDYRQGTLTIILYPPSLLSVGSGYISVWKWFKCGSHPEEKYPAWGHKTWTTHFWSQKHPPPLETEWDQKWALLRIMAPDPHSLANNFFWGGEGLEKNFKGSLTLYYHFSDQIMEIWEVVGFWFYMKCPFPFILLKGRGEILKKQLKCRPA